MSYKKIAEIPKAEKLTWTPERGGRTRQKIGGEWVPKYAYSPFTAKPRELYAWYADIEMEKEIESPPGSGKKIKHFTMEVFRGTYLGFKEEVLSGMTEDKMAAVVDAAGGGAVMSYGYWRNRGVDVAVAEDAE